MLIKFFDGLCCLTSFFYRLAIEKELASPPLSLFASMIYDVDFDDSATAPISWLPSMITSEATLLSCVSVAAARAVVAIVFWPLVA